MKTKIKALEAQRDKMKELLDSLEGNLKKHALEEIENLQFDINSLKSQGPVVLTEHSAFIAA